MKCIAVFQKDLEGQITFQQSKLGDVVTINGIISKLKPGKHGFHVHTFGNLKSTDCMKCGGHWNPENCVHGGRHDEVSHAGDLGNITANVDGVAKFRLSTNKIQLHGNVKESIVGRSVVIHADEDDNGKGGFDDSLTTGHAGARLDCAVIGWMS